MSQILTNNVARVKGQYKRLGYDVKSTIVKAEYEAIGSALSDMASKLNRYELAVLALRRDFGFNILNTDNYREILGNFARDYNVLCKRLSDKAITRAEFERALQLADMRIVYSLNNNEIKLFPISTSNLVDVSEFINGYIPFGITPVLGNGLMFERWEGLNCNWNYFDKLELSFDTIDRMGVDLYE